MSGSRWKFMQRFEIPDVTDPSQTYLRRWNVICTPWFSLKVHNIRLADGDRALHSHPWPFATWVIKGGYLEEVPDYAGQEWGPWRTHFEPRNRWSLHRLKVDGIHRIHEVAPNTWTIVVTGGAEREWGFCPRAGEWIPWRTYLGLDEYADSGD